jgi:hypothetical protein
MQDEKGPENTFTNLGELDTPSYEDGIEENEKLVDFHLYEDDQSWQEKLENDPVERFKRILDEYKENNEEEAKFRERFVKPEPSPTPSESPSHGFGTYISGSKVSDEFLQENKETTPSRLVELSSLSSQGTNSFKELADPKVLTEKMLENLEILRNNIPFPNVGISLHTGVLVDLDMVRDESKLPVTSVDTPAETDLLERFKVIWKRPAQWKEHIGWGVNSSFGLTPNSARENLLNSFNKAQEMEQFGSQPFIRISADQGPRFESLLSTITQKLPGVTVAIEFDAEKMTLEQYISLVQRLRIGNKNIGISWDPAHAYEGKFLEKFNGRNPRVASQYARESGMNTYANLLKENSVPIFSIDYNNLPSVFNGFGNTHKYVLEPGGAIDNKSVVDQFNAYLKRSNTSGRMVFPETSPTQSTLLVTKEGIAYALSQVASFTSSR